MPEKNKGGRPRNKLDDEQAAQVEALASALSVDLIADYFGFSRDTFYRILERQPEVLQRYKRGKAKAIGNVAKSLLKQALGGNTSAMMFYLKTQAGWRETQNIDVTSSDQPLVIVKEAE